MVGILFKIYVVPSLGNALHKYFFSREAKRQIIIETHTLKLIHKWRRDRGSTLSHCVRSNNFGIFVRYFLYNFIILRLFLFCLTEPIITVVHLILKLSQDH